MSLFRTPEEHAENGPDTWTVERIQSGSRTRWQIVDKQGTPIGGTHATRREAEDDLERGPDVTLWEKEQRWYAGESIPGWKSWEQCKAERERNEAWQAARRAEKENAA